MNLIDKVVNTPSAAHSKNTPPAHPHCPTLTLARIKKVDNQGIKPSMIQPIKDIK